MGHAPQLQQLQQQMEQPRQPQQMPPQMPAQQQMPSHAQQMPTHAQQQQPQYPYQPNAYQPYGQPQGRPEHQGNQRQPGTPGTAS